MTDYPSRAETIATHAWEIWTCNGLGMDVFERGRTSTQAMEAARNAFHRDYTSSQWLARTLERLGVTDRGNG